MSPRPQTHLRQLVEEHGEAAGSRFIVDLLEQGLQEKQRRKDEERAKEKGPDHKQTPYFTDTLKCERAVYFRLTGEPQTEPITTDSHINFQIGHAIEDAFAQMLSYPGIQMVREQSVEFFIEGGRISGRLDFLLMMPEERALVELKSINSRSMGYMLKELKPGREEHRHQLNLYLHASQEGKLEIPRFGPNGGPSLENGTPLQNIDYPKFDLGYLVYIVKDPTKGEPPIHAFAVPYDKAMAEGDLAWLHQVAVKADKRIDPGIPLGYEKKKYPCSYCQWKTRCWGKR